jgi:hypothetical protein
VGRGEGGSGMKGRERFRNEGERIEGMIVGRR